MSPRRGRVILGRTGEGSMKKATILAVLVAVFAAAVLR